MTATVKNQAPQSGWFEVLIEGSASTHDLGNILNPEGCDLVITDGYLEIDKAGLATSDLHIGIGAASTGVAQNDLGNNLPVDGTVGTIYSLFHGAAVSAEQTTPAIWHAADYLTFFTDTAYSTGFIGRVYLKYLRMHTAASVYDDADSGVG